MTLIELLRKEFVNEIKDEYDDADLFILAFDRASMRAIKIYAEMHGVKFSVSLIPEYLRPRKTIPTAPEKS